MLLLKNHPKYQTANKLRANLNEVFKYLSGNYILAAEGKQA